MKPLKRADNGFVVGVIHKFLGIGFGTLPYPWCVKKLFWPMLWTWTPFYKLNCIVWQARFMWFVVVFILPYDTRFYKWA